MGPFLATDVVHVRRLDPGQPVDPVAGSTAPTRYLDTAVAPIELRCQATYATRDAREEQAGSAVGRTNISIRWRDRDWRAKDNRSPPKLRRGDLIIAMTKPKQRGGTVQTEAVTLWIDDPAPAAQGFGGVTEWTAKLLSAQPGMV